MTATCRARASTPSAEGSGLEVVTHTLGTSGWRRAATIASASVDGRRGPQAAHAAPDGSRLLLVYPDGDGSATSARLVDARSGQPVPIAGGQRVMRFSGRLGPNCVTLAGYELSGTPVQGSGIWRDRVWPLVLPLGGVLVLVGGVWMVVALRRSRKHGEDFLPMVLRLPF